jgi:uncharacterized phage protein (TIGR01671 family)
MNREILFRGKCVSDSKYAGEWVTGGYVAPDADCKKRNEGLIVEYFGGNTTITYHVDPDTVGQFVGMKDKHGNKVFEGDIVEVYDFTSAYASKYRGVVKMYRGSWCVEYEDSIIDTVFHPMLFFDDFADRKTEIISNIYDNPELLSAQ